MKVAIVSGGTSGIGKGAVLTLLDEGFTVVTFSRDKEKCAELEKELQGKNVLVLVGDVTNEDQMQGIVKKTIDKYGQLNLLMNNAGVGYWTPAAEGDIEIFRKMIDINVVGVAILTKHALPHLLKAKGQIIITASSAGKQGYASGSFYCATKYAVLGYADSLRKEVSPDVKVCSLCPGMVKTNLFPKEVWEHRKQSKANFRIMEVEDTNRAIRMIATQSETSDIREVFMPTTS